MAEELHLQQQQQQPEEAQEQPAVEITDDANAHLPAAAGANLPEDIAAETRKDTDATAVTNHNPDATLSAVAALVADPAVVDTTTLLVDFPSAKQKNKTIETTPSKPTMNDDPTTTAETPLTSNTSTAIPPPRQSPPLRQVSTDTAPVPKTSLPTLEECLFGKENNNTDGNATNMIKDTTSSTTTDENVDDSEMDSEAQIKEKYFVPLALLRRVSSQGIDDTGIGGSESHRGLAWRLLLGMLPPDRRLWHESAASQRLSYQNFVHELFCLEPEDWDGRQLRGHRSKKVNVKKEKLTKLQRKERREERRKLRESPQKQLLPDTTTTSSVPRPPVKFVDEAPRHRTASVDSALSVSEDEDLDPDISNNDVATDDKPPEIHQNPLPTNDNNNPKNKNDVNNNDNQNKNSRNETKNDSETPQSQPQQQQGNDDDLLPTEQDELRLSSSDLLQDDPADWNMTVREQKILERLTHLDAVNQLLVSRKCQEWNNFLENATLLDEIRKDVNRTHPHLYFYLEPTERLGAKRYGALERILFVWAKLNKGVRYVQGMNEIVGTLYYVLANDCNDEWADHAEADTYILFNKIMSEMRDIFVADMDTADTGIVGRIDNMQNLLQLHDPQTKSHLVDMGIDASFYAVRWLTTLLSREFLLPDTIRLWDSMFASTHKENFLRYVCVTMVLKIRDDLLKADFATCLQLLQKYPNPTGMDALLDASRALWIYESQITMACLKGGLTLHQALQAIPPSDKVIMAFGLRGGLVMTNQQQLDEIKENAREAVNKVAKAGQGFLGRAQRFMQTRMRSKSPSAASSNNSDHASTSDDRGATGRRSKSPGPRRRMFRNFSFGNQQQETAQQTVEPEIVADESKSLDGRMVPDDLDVAALTISDDKTV